MEWFREEKFWRDVGTRTFAGMFTAAILYLGALFLGYLGAPHVAGTVSVVIGIIFIVALALCALGVLRALPRRARAGQPLAGRLVLLVVIAALLVLLVVVLLTGGVA